MDMQTVTHNKNGQTYVFRYISGSEDEMVDEIMKMAESAQCDLDWLDAATLSFQIAKTAAGPHIAEPQKFPVPKH